MRLTTSFETWGVGCHSSSPLLVTDIMNYFHITLSLKCIGVDGCILSKIRRVTSFVAFDSLRVSVMWPAEIACASACVLPPFSDTNTCMCAGETVDGEESELSVVRGHLDRSER